MPTYVRVVLASAPFESDICILGTALAARLSNGGRRKKFAERFPFIGSLTVQTEPKRSRRATPLSHERSFIGYRVDVKPSSFRFIRSPAKISPRKMAVRVCRNKGTPAIILPVGIERIPENFRRSSCRVSSRWPCFDTWLVKHFCSSFRLANVMPVELEIV